MLHASIKTYKYKTCSSLLLRKAVSKRNFKLLLDRAAVLQLGLVEALQMITILDAKSGNMHQHASAS